MSHGHTGERLNLAPLFNPASVAVVGASPTNLASRAALANLASPRYGGQVGAVSPRYESVLGVPCVPTLTELDFVPESIIVSVNRSLVLPVLEEAAGLGVKAAVVFGIGFAETGADGAAKQETLKGLAAEHSMAFLGPNCQGIINFADFAPMYMDDVKPYAAGRAGLIAQSGSVSTALINNQRGVRWRYAVSTGNEAVVNAADLLWHMVEDEDCHLVCLFLETIRDPDSFFAACARAAERDLPIVVLKTGTTEASQQAALAHSGALAVPDRLVDALFARHGVIRVQTLEELLETAIALQTHHRPARGGLATMTASGGQIELVLDVTERVGLHHASLEPASVTQLETILPDFLAPQNPLDYWGVADDEVNYPRLKAILARDPGVEIVMAVVDQTTAPTGDGRFEQPLTAALELAAENPDKLFVLLESVGGTSPASRVQEAADQGVLLLSGFETGIRALGHLVDYSRRARTNVQAGPVRMPESSVGVGREPFSGVPALQLLANSGLPVADWQLVSDGDEAVRAADRLGYPVVAKIAAADVAHKTELGGVIANLDDAAAVRAAVARIQSTGFSDVLIQQQLSGVELIFGVTTHPGLGSFLVVGLGGIWTEVLGEVEIVPVGLLEGEAGAILGRLRGKELLEGARGSAPVDRAALIDVLEKFDDFAVQLGGAAASIDVNPVIATPKGAWAVDALIVPAVSQTSAADAESNARGR